MTDQAGGRWVPPDGAEVDAWVRERLPDVADVEVVRVRPWSTQAMVTTTDGGRAWFKAPHPTTAHEPALLRLVEELAPGTYVVPVAADRRGWMLTVDEGPTLAEDGLDVAGWCRLVAEAAELQRRTAVAAADGRMTALGVHDTRPGTALEVLEGVLDGVQRDLGRRPDPVLGGFADRVAAGRPHVVRAVERLTAAPLGPALDVADLHPGNVLARCGPGGRFRCLDVGDAHVTHPFALLTVPLAAVAAAHGPAAAERVRDAYLEGWSDLVDRAAALALLPAAGVLSAVGRADTWWGVLADATDDDRATWSPAALADLARLGPPAGSGGSMGR